jgi:hypothetical protein
MYFVTGDTTRFYIEKYQPGTTASVVVASGTGAWNILGLRFNKNDNMLYAIRVNHPATGFDFIKINPSGGPIATVAGLSFDVNPDFYSATIDPCSNRYILSSMKIVGGLPSNHLYQLSMTGTILQDDVTPTFYQGLDVSY